jgi:hypothetical protein
VTTLHAVPDDADGPRYAAMEVCALAGITYRQLDVWCTAGYLRDTANGSGSRRTFTGPELDVVRLVKHLIDAGFTVPAAFVIAWDVSEHDRYETPVADIFSLTVSVNDPARPTEGARP